MACITIRVRIHVAQTPAESGPATSCRAVPIDLRHRLLKLVLLEAMLVGVVLPSHELLLIPHVFFPQSVVLRAEATKTLCEHTPVAGGRGLFTQRRLPCVVRGFDFTVACERLSGRSYLQLPADHLDQLLPRELRVRRPSVQQ